MEILPKGWIDSFLDFFVLGFGSRQWRWFTWMYHMRRLERGTCFPPARSKFWPGSWIYPLRWLRRKSWRRGASLTWPGECLGWCQLASWESGVASGTRSGRPSPCGGQLKTFLKSDPNTLICLCFSNHFTQIYSLNLCSLRWRYRTATLFFWRSGLTEQKLWDVVRKWLEMILHNIPMTFPSSLLATDLQSPSATSAATFLATKCSCILAITGSTSFDDSCLEPTREEMEDQMPPDFCWPCRVSGLVTNPI